MKRLYTLALGAAVLAVAVQGCTTEDPELYLGGPAAPAAALQLSASRIDLAAGGSAVIGMRVVDAAGNTVPAVAPTATSGNAAVATATAGAADEQWTATATVAAVGLGEAMLTVSGAGFSTEVVVRVGPASLTLSRADGGPAEVPSGGSADYEIKAWDLAGNPLTVPADFPAWPVTSTLPARVSVTPVDGNPLLWTATGAQPGSVDLRVSTDTKAPLYGPYVNGKATVTVVPGTFAGTLSAATAAPGAVITATKAASGPIFDADSKVTLATTSALVEGFTANTITFAVPATGASGAATLTLLDMGADQLAQTIGFTSTSAFEDAYHATNTNATVSPQATAPEVSTIMTANRNVYFSHAGYGTGSAARGAWNGGPQVDHYFKVTTGAAAQTVTLTLSWTNGSDVDLFILNEGGTEVAFAYSGSTTNEILTYTFPANSVHYVAASMYNAGTNITNFKFNFAGLTP
jgi:hypothetical protein